MKKIILLVAVLLFSGCAKKPEPVVLEPVTIEMLASPPSNYLLEAPEKPKVVVKGSDNGKVLEVMTNNNRVASETQNKLVLLQEYVKNLFRKK